MTTDSGHEPPPRGGQIAGQPGADAQALRGHSEASDEEQGKNKRTGQAKSKEKERVLFITPEKKSKERKEQGKKR
jgi:hypothetical protein